ncbi:MAG: hypothetical protein AAB358_00110 [Patescibacteria group bacterium]
MATVAKTPQKDYLKASKERVKKKPYVAGLVSPLTVVLTRKMTLLNGQEVKEISLENFLDIEEYFDEQWEKISTQAERKTLKELDRMRGRIMRDTIPG